VDIVFLSGRSLLVIAEALNVSSIGDSLSSLFKYGVDFVFEVSCSLLVSWVLVSSKSITVWDWILVEHLVGNLGKSEDDAERTDKKDGENDSDDDELEESLSISEVSVFPDDIRWL